MMTFKKDSGQLAVLNPIADADDRTVYAIGDVHACFEHLEVMLEFIRRNEYGDGEPLVIFLGDLNDRGGNTRKVHDLVLRTMDEFPGSHSIMGNHDQVLLDYWQGMEDTTLDEWMMYYGGIRTVNSFECEPNVRQPKDLKYLEFLEAMPDLTAIGNMAFCHAGINWNLPFARQMKKFMQWGGAEFYEGYEPSDRIAFFGHMAHGCPMIWRDKICIDTRCYGSGKLTTALISGGMVRFYQTDPESGSSFADMKVSPANYCEVDGVLENPRYSDTNEYVPPFELKFRV